MPAHSPLATKDRLPATLREVGSRTVVAMTQPRPFLRRAYTTVGGLLRAALVVVGTPEALVSIALPIGLHGVGGAHASNFELAAIPLLALVVIGVLSPRSAPRLTRSMGARPVPVRRSPRTSSVCCIPLSDPDLDNSPSSCSPTRTPQRSSSALTFSGSPRHSCDGNTHGA